jgi:hypothetical protein
MMLMDLMKMLRIPLACALTAAFVLIFLLGAPIAPVVAGCTLSLLYLFLKSWFRLSSGKPGN